MELKPKRVQRSDKDFFSIGQGYCNQLLRSYLYIRESPLRLERAF